MELIHDTNTLERVLGPLRGRRRVGLVPTMGALHAGHLTLLERGRAGGAELVVASIFVNPTQFGPHEDFSRYPRTLAADLEALEAAGCDLAFVPTVEAVYPPGFDDFVDPDSDPRAPSHGFEGAARPGHFRGVATVVNRLFAVVRPQLAVFGEKDAQQLAVIRWLVARRELPIEILAAPVVRESDGVAMSSRNRYLEPAARRAAAVIPRALARAADLAERGERDGARLVEAVRRELATEPRIDTVDYVALVDEHNFVPLEHLDSSARLVLAARIGATRLLDTRHFSKPNLPHWRADPMFRTMMKSKIHRATVTHADLDYVGSVTLDVSLMEAADLLPNERVEIYNITNGERFATYAIPGPRGQGDVGLNGAAAHKVSVGDLVIIASYATMTDLEARQHVPAVVFVDGTNRLVELGVMVGG